MRVLPSGIKVSIVGRRCPDKHNREIGAHTVGGRLVDHHRVKQKFRSLGKLEVNWHIQISQALSRRRERSHQGGKCFQNKRTVDQLQKSALTEHKQPEFTDNMKRASLSRRNISADNS